MRCAVFVALLGLVATQARAEDAPAGLVAGYKALFACSGTFLADRTPEQIARNELAGIYRDYEPVLAKLGEAQIDRAKGTVSVAYGETMPPRIARFRRSLGCSLLPPGADAVMPLPEAEVDAPPADLSELAWPDGDRLENAPLGADPDGAPLARLLALGFDAKTYGENTRTSAIVVVRQNRIEGEAYSQDSGVHVPQRTWSVAKTLTGALIGIAVQDEILKLGDAAAIPQWSARGDPRGRIRIVDLMHMSSGLDSAPAGNRTDEVYFGGARVEDRALKRELAAPPGTRWAYANNDTLALVYVLRARIANDPAYFAFPYRRLFQRIGMWHTTAETDWAGNFILSSQVWTTARDLARFGQLLLDDGAWYGEQVLPKGWVAELAKPAPVQPPLVSADGTAQPGYGKQVWLLGARHGLPEGTLAAMGNRGQYVVIVPARRAVIVRRGFDGAGVRFAIDRFAADVLEVLEDA